MREILYDISWDWKKRDLCSPGWGLRLFVPASIFSILLELWQEAFFFVISEKLESYLCVGPAMAGGWCCWIQSIQSGAECSKVFFEKKKKKGAEMSWWFWCVLTIDDGKMLWLTKHNMLAGSQMLTMSDIYEPYKSSIRKKNFLLSFHQQPRPKYSGGPAETDFPNEGNMFIGIYV